MSAPHRFPVRVYYEDTDAGGIVYHASYLRFFERGRTEYLRSWGVDHRALRERHGLIFAVRSCSIDYRAPARLDDQLEIVTEITNLGASRLDMRQYIRHEENILTAAQITVVAVATETGRATRIPDELRRKITPLIVPPGPVAGTTA